MRTTYSVILSEQERAYLHTLLGQGTAAARLLTHARILVKANQGEAGPGWTDAALATARDVGLATVARVRQRYVEAGVDAALVRKAPDREYRRNLDGDQEAHVIALAWSAPPAGRQRWTMRLLAKHLVVLAVVDGVSHETVRQTVPPTSSRRG